MQAGSTERESVCIIDEGGVAARVFTRRIVLGTKGMESPRGASTGEDVTGEMKMVGRK